jgi:branched-chain amino acid transport system ATP-binding protein
VETVLKIDHLETHYGHIHALKGISLEVNRESIATVLGANGAGKSTLLRAISGLISLLKGRIEFEGREIEGMKPHKIVKLGISHVPEGRELFPDLTVLENLRMGAFVRTGTAEIRQDIDTLYGYFPILQERHHQIASTLSGGEQQMLAIGRALMSRPKLLLLDEPSLGLAPLVVGEIYQIIQKIHQKGTSILLVEQNARLGLTIAGYGYVLETGKMVVSGRSDTLLQNEHVRKAYLGK